MCCVCVAMCLLCCCCVCLFVVVGVGPCVFLCVPICGCSLCVILGQCVVVQCRVRVLQFTSFASVCWCWFCFVFGDCTVVVEVLVFSVVVLHMVLRCTYGCL